MSEDTPPTFFPELEGDVRKEADLWLRDYLALVIRIAAGPKTETRSSSYPHPMVDCSIGTGTIGTPLSPSGPTGEV